MSICLDSITLRENKKERLLLRNTIGKNNRAVLRCSENILKPKCNKALKRKLKKYKLRKDGKEDQEIIDVSLSFIKSLTIKSPNQTISEREKPPSKVKQSFTMGRKKRNNVGIEVAEVNGMNSVTSEQLVSSQDTQGKKQTDAFKLLMDSRNKIIGSNSPGKECIVETNHDQEVVGKKEIKAKRILSLQKMAQAKGASEKLKQEESRELYIKKKMENRAERLKNMITKSDINLNKKNINDLNASKLCEIKEKSSKVENISDNKNIIFSKTLSSILPNTLVPRMTFNKTVSEEEEKFLKKLSPSIRKKENMLCYLNVITKDTECVSNTSQNDIHENNSETIIKVKFSQKKKKKKVTVNHQTIQQNSVATNNYDCEIIEKVACTSQDVVNFEVNNRQKRKRKNQIIETELNKCVEEISVETRPKRNTRKPVKFMESALTSSDDELHIFTPKKKKSFENKSEIVKTNQIENTKVRTNLRTDKPLKKYQNKKSSKINEKKVLKLAPIFITKPQLTPEELKAKQEFLHSGIPKHIKKNITSQLNNTSYNVFPKVIHIQQIPPKCNEVSNLILSLSMSNTNDEIEVTDVNLNLTKNLLNLEMTESNLTLDSKYNVDTMLRTMKQMYSKFPVYRTYHSLKAKSKGENEESSYNNLDNSVEIINDISDIWHDHPDKLKWTDKYKAISTKQIIGNFDSIKELRKWLITWTENVEEMENDSDSDFCYSDSNSGDVIRMKNNLLILTGKIGSGKTSSVYAVASELSMKVIEVNASGKRTGKIMLQDLQEATQSHKVNRQKDSENSQKSTDRETIILTKNKKHGKFSKSKEKLSQKSLFPKKSNSEPLSSQESIRTVVSLILIDDADIVFEQDDGFCSAVTQLIHSSKRPVILVTESLQCPHMQKFLKYGQVIKLQPFLPRMLGTWLDIMCLADVSMCYPGLGAKLLDLFRGDIRKCINHLQYYIISQKHICKQESGTEANEHLNNKLDVNDESSSTSWAVNEDPEEKASISNDILDSSINYYMCKHLNMHDPSHSLEFNVWWSLPQLLDFGMNEKKTSLEETVNSTNKILELETISSAMDNFSVLDMFQHTAKLHVNITSRPWFSSENASLTESENFECYDGNNEIKLNISHSLMIGTIKHAQKILKCEHKSYIHFPSMTQQRERDKIVDIHKNLANYFNQSAVLDRKAVSLDYWSSCRDICRTERTKTDSNVKRNNRYCHYLKSINILFKNNDFDKLGDSLCPDKND